MKFVVHKNEAGLMTWRLFDAKSGDLVAWAGETFPTTTEAEQAARAFKLEAPLASYRIYQDSPGAWRWRVWVGDAELVCSGESFVSRVAAERAVEDLKMRVLLSAGP